MAVSAEEKSAARTAAAHTRWAGVTDRSAAVAPAVEGQMRRFRRLADPDGVLSADVREQRAEQLRLAHLADCRRKAAKARRLRAEAAQLDREAAAGTNGD